MSQPIRITVVRYRCPHCSRSRASKAATAAHIGRCWNNPETRACRTCANYEVVPTGEPCIPGQPCSCNEGYIACKAGVDAVSDGTIVTACPSWVAEVADEDHMGDSPAGQPSRVWVVP